MNQAMNKQVRQPNTQTDSLFGMALTQAFMGFAFGVDVSMAWEAVEAADTIYVERRERANKGKFPLGVKNTLNGPFTRTATMSLSDMERETFKPSNLTSKPTRTLSMAA